MQLQAESNPALNTVTAYGEHYIEINAVRFDHAVHFSPEGAVRRWAATGISDITSQQLRDIAGVAQTSVSALDFLDTPEGRPAKPDGAPEVILLGTGKQQHFLPAAITRPLLDMGIGVEAMSTHAAARTYNILMAEGRRVVAALLPLESA
ncbi:MAG: Mth938-like domain-containing protein [Pusillimonas sp.]